ncbi:O-antigen ligase family protein [Blastococcus goldschmidtiae]|uniref:O-antigen ligase n=1 Tax=Blastococcus goldschmidtiae TaxID=3075546 RepID=A0ABU2K687_9ACTN|nr:hypothetical protein [Blastococcus sp. DSM 46792]MDT0275707.1 hypothetical protein [Blastococcus sp. DSM 46792]
MPVPSPKVAVISLLMIASTVVWRRGDIFSGGLDAVVVGKGALSVLALGLAFLTVPPRDRALRVGTGSLWLLGTLLVSGLLGALAFGTLVPTAVIAVRIVILAATVFFLLRSRPAMDVLYGAVWACGVVVAVATATGVSTLTSGRLEGGVPPLNPNEMAALAALVVLWIAWRTVCGETRPMGLLLATVYLGIIWATGSRTALAMLVLAMAVMALHLRRPAVGLVVGGLLLAGIGSLAAVSTGAVASFAERDGAGASTLESRFIAWRAAGSWAESLWQGAFGGGLSVKLIPIEGQWWDEQLLDSTWVSALVQAGVLGLVTVAVWVLWILRSVLRAPRRFRVLFLGLTVFLVGRSFLESGLFDATPMFLVLLAVSLLAEGGSRARLGRDEEHGTGLPSAQVDRRIDRTAERRTA